MGFKANAKMKSTELSADEVSAKGMKSGGKTKKMAVGGGMPMGALPAAAAPAMGRAMPARPPMGARKPDPRQAMIEAAMAQKAAQAQAPMMRKKGGKAEGGESKAESKAEMKADKAQDKAMISKAFKQQDVQEHKGDKGTNLKLAKGGKMKGYKNGGVIQKFATGGVVGFADGGFAKMSCEGGSGHKANKKGGSW